MKLHIWNLESRKTPLFFLSSRSRELIHFFLCPRPFTVESPCYDFLSVFQVDFGIFSKFFIQPYTVCYCTNSLFGQSDVKSHVNLIAIHFAISDVNRNCARLGVRSHPRHHRKSVRRSERRSLSNSLTRAAEGALVVERKRTRAPGPLIRIHRQGGP